MAGEGKNKDGQGSEELGSRMEKTNLLLGGQGLVRVGVVIDDDEDQVENCSQGQCTSGLQRIQTLQEGDGSNDGHKDGDPEPAVDQEPELRVHIARAIASCSSIRNHAQRPHDLGHQVSNDDQVRDADTEALDSNRHVESNSCPGICEF